MQLCEVCHGQCKQGLTAWHYECLSCRTEHSTLVATINGGTAEIQPDEHGRAIGLAPIRAAGYRQLLQDLSRLRPAQRGSLLEVGSSYGWFLHVAQDSFDRVTGIEPDDAVRSQAFDPACEVRPGYFPQALSSHEQFDVIVFNDVFEHIPHTASVAAAVRDALGEGGIAVLNLPINTGALYRLTKAAHRVGIHGPFERMWQMRFPSPHLFYFSRRGLESLMATVDLECVRSCAMPSVRVNGLWQRVRHAEPRLPVALATYAISLLIAPVLRAAPADVECLFFQKRVRG